MELPRCFWVASVAKDGTFLYSSLSKAVEPSKKMTNKSAPYSCACIELHSCQESAPARLSVHEERLGTPVVPFFLFYSRVSSLKLNMRKKGTLIIKGLLGNLVGIRRIVVIRRNSNPTKNTNDNHISSNSSNTNMNQSST